MDVHDLDWSPQERVWGKHRQEDGPAGQAGGGAGRSVSADFHMRPGETSDNAVRLVHNSAQEWFVQEYVRREQRAYALAKAEREREHGRELRAGVEAGQRPEQERLQAQYNAELAHNQEDERQRLQAH